jgi:molybdenum cofactor cytidylyltransferase
VTAAGDADRTVATDLSACGVILAAGRSRRMGAQKLSLPWPPGGSSTVVASCFDVLSPWCGRMILVIGVGDAAEVVRSALGPARVAAAEFVESDPDAAMFESVRRGLAAARTLPLRHVLLCPGDHVGAATAPIPTLLHAARHSSGRAVIPEYAGRGGHPAVIPAELIERILGWSGVDGLAGFWRSAPELVLRIPVDDPLLLRDLDTPEQYARDTAPATGGRVEADGRVREAP